MSYSKDNELIMEAYSNKGSSVRYFYFEAPYGDCPNHPEGIFYFRGLVPKSHWIGSYNEYGENLASELEPGFFRWGEDEGFMAIREDLFSKISNEYIWKKFEGSMEPDEKPNFMWTLNEARKVDERNTLKREINPETRDTFGGMIDEL